MYMLYFYVMNVEEIRNLCFYVVISDVVVIFVQLIRIVEYLLVIIFDNKYYVGGQYLLKFLLW